MTEFAGLMFTLPILLLIVFFGIVIYLVRGYRNMGKKDDE